VSTPYTTEELVALHKRSLLDAASAFDAPDDADFIRHLSTAARAVAQDKRTRTQLGVVVLVAGTALYPVPDGLLQTKTSPWGVDLQLAQPWCAPRAPLPSLRVVERDGVQWLMLHPAPSALQISAFGADYPYYYLAAHRVPASGPGTVTDRELDLVLLRAKVEALRELAIRNNNKPVTLRGGTGGAGTSPGANTTPAALYERFLREYQETP
jgi:hypothetical protein